MKLRNKKTGKVIEWFNNTDGIFPNTLAELNEEWEDVPEESEELKDFWFITNHCEVSHKLSPKDDWPEEDKKWAKGFKECGNYFETEEEAEKVVEKLKAYKRLKEKGILFVRCRSCQSRPYIRITDKDDRTMFDDDINDDIDLLFEGKD